MRYVYAHFPINVNIDKNNETGNYEVEIRYGALGDGRKKQDLGKHRADLWGTAGTLSVRRSFGGS